jgi:hypothetical protein
VTGEERRDPLASRPPRTARPANDRAESEERPPGLLRRRKLLGRGFLVAMALLLTINVATAVRERGGEVAAATFGMVTDGLRRVAQALPGASEVRVYRAGPVRWLANRVLGPVRIGLQVGHLDAGSQPDELAALRYSTGGHHAGLDEVSVNAAIVDALAARLRGRGAVVDVLPATVPPRYRADLMISVHIDSNPDTARSGYKSAHFWPARNPREPQLKLQIDRAVLKATRMSDDDANVSGNMFEYYAFNDRRFEHAVDRGTPALLVELGYLSNPADRRLLETPDALAAALEDGIIKYLISMGRVPDKW